MDLKGNNTCDDSVSAVYVTAIFLTLSVTGILSAVVGNTLVFVAVFKTRALRTSANYLLVSLSMASLLFVPVLVSYAISLTMRECDPIMKKLCPWSSKVDFVLFCVVMLHLLFISLDRLVAIKMPLRYVVRPELYNEIRKITSKLRGYKHNETTHVVKTFIYEVDVSYASTYIFRSNGYPNYN